MINNVQLVEKITTARILLSGMSVDDSSKQSAINNAKGELELAVNDLPNGQLVEKIAKAKIYLDGLQFHHTCMIDGDPDYTGPCGCGSTVNNATLKKVEKALNLS